MTRTFPIAEQIAEARRELTMRYKVYPGMVSRGSMTQEEMDRRIAVQHAIVETLQTLDPQPALFPRETTHDHRHD